MSEIKYEVRPHNIYPNTHITLYLRGVAVRTYRRDQIKPIFTALGAYLAKEGKGA